ncbi:MAG: carboxylating nicotinate-nucleotide diphosphorylase [Candidatus Gracilibacteria bacterium]|jgi:nicotinate-nucleotide pyrophosphorylase (carboxylating)|nr:carboxylating nicotinate-nucleotide diphosphorylase [Candidatus Gracilibacteria bacterium]
MKIPHDRSEFLTIKNKKYLTVFADLFSYMLKQEGDDVTSLNLFADKQISVKGVVVAGDDGIFAGREELEGFFDVFLSEDQRKKQGISQLATEIMCKDMGIFEQGAIKGEIFFKRSFDLRQEWLKKDGEQVKKGDVLMNLYGDVKCVLRLERNLLNFLSRMSGIATKTSKLVQKMPKGTYLACTRKTLWGVFDKKAVHLGGGLTHRLNLTDAILIKENHLSVFGENFADIAKRIDNRAPFWEVEIETEEQFWNLMYNLPKSIGVIMFDNFEAKKIKELIEKVKEKPQNLFFEASGGINESNLLEYVNTGVDVVSMGALTNNPHSLDLSMYVEKL